MDEAIGIGLMVSTIKYQVFPQKTCGELSTYIKGIKRAIAT